MRIIIGFIFTFLTISDSYAYYMSIDPGYSSFSNSTLSENNAKIDGFGASISLGFQKTRIPMEIFIGQNSLSGEVLHDGAKREIKAKQLTIGARVLVPISEAFYLSAGYAKSETEFILNESSEFTNAGIRNTYELQDDDLTGFQFGAGLSLNNSRVNQFYFEYKILNFTENSAKTTNINLGYRRSFD